MRHLKIFAVLTIVIKKTINNNNIEILTLKEENRSLKDKLGLIEIEHEKTIKKNDDRSVNSVNELYEKIAGLRSTIKKLEEENQKLTIEDSRWRGRLDVAGAMLQHVGAVPNGGGRSSDESTTSNSMIVRGHN